MSDQIKRGLGIEDVIGGKRDAVIALAARHGAINVRVFGSVARGEGTPDSDIDLLVTFPAESSMFDLVGLWLDMQELLGREVSLIADEPHPRRERFMANIRKDAVAL
jgi:predicted nucleotidyltransferase